jgi:hypothetical protein
VVITVNGYVHHPSYSKFISVSSEFMRVRQRLAILPTAWQHIYNTELCSELTPPPVLEQFRLLYVSAYNMVFLSNLQCKPPRHTFS